MNQILAASDKFPIVIQSLYNKLNAALKLSDSITGQINSMGATNPNVMISYLRNDYNASRFKVPTDTTS